MVGEAGDGTFKSLKGVANPTGECFTDHCLCYQEDSGPRKNQLLQPQGAIEVLETH